MTCERSNILREASRGYLSPYSGIKKSTKSGSYYDSCLWTISGFNISHDELIYGVEQTPHPDILFHILATQGVSCFDSMLAVYDGVPPNPRVQSAFVVSPFKLLGIVCGSIGNSDRYFRSTTGVLTLVYQGQVAMEPVKLDYNTNGFLGEYTRLECPDWCPSPFVCEDENGTCACPAGFSGVMCEVSICPNFCNNATDQGWCDQVSLLSTFVILPFNS